MMPDSEPICQEEKSKSSPFTFAFSLMGSKKLKMAGFLFLIFVIITSDIFVMRVLSHIDSAVDYKTSTNYGVMLQGIFLIIFWIIVDLGLEKKIL